jgi:hypothetical protein
MKNILDLAKGNTQQTVAATSQFAPTRNAGGAK